MEKKEVKEVKETKEKTTAKKPTAKKATEKKPTAKKSAEKATEKKAEKPKQETKEEAKVVEEKKQDKAVEQTAESQVKAETASTDGFAEITPETETKELNVLYHLTDGGDVRVSMAISHDKWQMHIITKRKESYQNGLCVALEATQRGDKVEAMRLMQEHFDKVVEYCKTHKLVFMDTEPTVEVVGL